jgi:hypothetical protein
MTAFAAPQYLGRDWSNSGHDAAIARSISLALLARAQRDDDHVAILIVDELLPELVHAGRTVLEIDAGRQRDARRVEAERVRDLEFAGVSSIGRRGVAILDGRREPYCAASSSGRIRAAGVEVFTRPRL